MGTGNNDVGKDTPHTATGRPGTKCQGAMSLQGYGWHGNECYPQGFVRLVGHRDPQPSRGWDRLRVTGNATQPID